MSLVSFRNKNIVNNSREYKESKFKDAITHDKYRKISKDLSSLMCKEVIDNQEGLFIPELGQFYISKFKTTYTKNWKSKIIKGKIMRNLHSFGYVFRCNWKPVRGIKYKKLYKFTAHRDNINRAIIDRIWSGDHNYIKEEWSL